MSTPLPLRPGVLAGAQGGRESTERRIANSDDLRFRGVRDASVECCSASPRHSFTPPGLPYRTHLPVRLGIPAQVLSRRTETSPPRDKFQQRPRSRERRERCLLCPSCQVLRAYRKSRWPDGGRGRYNWAGRWVMPPFPSAGPSDSFLQGDSFPPKERRWCTTVWL